MAALFTSTSAEVMKLVFAFLHTSQSCEGVRRGPGDSGGLRIAADRGNTVVTVGVTAEFRRLGGLLLLSEPNVNVLLFPDPIVVLLLLFNTSTVFSP